MSKLNKNFSSSLSKSTEISFLSNPSFSNKNYSKNTVKNKIPKIFEVCYKKNIIYTKTKSNEIIIQYECFYCKNKYNNIYRFEAHMRIHVSKNKIKI